MLFIPDISGFTKFVSETEISHSRLIVQELLELLIEANVTGLQISEIEGDAILFYQFGHPPLLNDVYHQVERMFKAFHQRLLTYEYRRFCQCKACTSAIHLTLKIITHYGEFTRYSVQRFQKLIGRDVIIAHQLLKNDIDRHEYWLLTDELLQNHPLPAESGLQWSQSVKHTEAGAVPFRYAQLTALKQDIKPEPLPQLDLTHKTKMFSLTREYNTGLIALFHATGDFTYRHRWQVNVQKVEEVPHFLPRVGMRLRSTGANGESIVYASSYSFSPERIEFSETNEKDGSTNYYTLEKLDEGRTRLTIDHYLPKKFLKEALFRLMQQKEKKAAWTQSLANLQELVKEIKLPV